MSPHHQRRVLVLDLDDTLLRSDATISDHTQASLNQWRDAGHAIVIATGRPTRSIASVLPPDLHSVYWITYNGAYIYLDDVKIYENLIPPEAVQSIVETVNQLLPDCALGVEIDDTLFL